MKRKLRGLRKRRGKRRKNKKSEVGRKKRDRIEQWEGDGGMGRGSGEEEKGCGKIKNKKHEPVLLRHSDFSINKDNSRYLKYSRWQDKGGGRKGGGRGGQE